MVTEEDRMTAFCRECLHQWDGTGRCPACLSPRTKVHPELATLAIAHLDADAFFAAIEKRDDPTLRDKPVIVGGGRRGVVSTACYIARLSGVRSAMPMFQARKLCPDAIIVPPRMTAYAEASRAIRAMMLDLTPLVEPLSLDEAFLDLSGTERLHRAPPALLLARLQARIEAEVGITTSVGLSHNKFLAKIASEQDKPRGFAVIGRAETQDFLDALPVSAIWGVGRAAVQALEQEGIRRIVDLRSRDRAALIRRFGTNGDRLWRLSRGEDARLVSPDQEIKTISHETTFLEDTSDADLLRRHLWSLAEQVSQRAKQRCIAGMTVTLKLKRANHAIVTRRQTLDCPTATADRLYRTAEAMLHRNMNMSPFRLIGVGLDGLTPAQGEGNSDLFDSGESMRLAAERAADQIRARYGRDAIILGRSLP